MLVFAFSIASASRASRESPDKAVLGRFRTGFAKPNEARLVAAARFDMTEIAADEREEDDDDCNGPAGQIG